ncbi:MAG: hypothetical protein K2O91_10585 [Lachnospiraceae bacterium]|nr:hypothetical protein [Lachnospiraceae bacterium]
MTDKDDKTVRQFVLFCRTALMYEKRTITTNENTRQNVKCYFSKLPCRITTPP